MREVHNGAKGADIRTAEESFDEIATHEGEFDAAKYASWTQELQSGDIATLCDL